MLKLDRAELLGIAHRIRPYLHKTPLWHSETLSSLCGFEVFLKAELLQKTGSYKPRGMLWSLMSMSDDQRRKGVITFSAGNAAQGLAYAGRILGTHVTVAMTVTASPIKVQATRDYGAEVILYDSSQECLINCRKLAEERELAFISPYDDLALMQGHATLGLEAIDALPSLDAIVLGVGGGGMLGGVALALQACECSAELIGVEPYGAAAMSRSIEEGHAVALKCVNTVADGLAAPEAGKLCYRIAAPRTGRIVLVSDEEIVNSMRILLERCKLFAEPAGAAALAGLLSGRSEISAGANVVCVVSGGNCDLERLKALL